MDHVGEIVGVPRSPSRVRPNRITAIGGETYAYDGAGRRIATWAADGRTKVEVYTKDGKLGFAVDSAKGGGSSFIYLAGQRIAEDHWHCGTDTHTVSYFHADALGSTVATTDAARNILERTYYAPYGEALNRSVDGPGYTGHVMDAATGLVYAQQRYYDPLVGKFLSIDPVAANPGTGGNFNRYWYANDNPYRFTDPDGRSVLIKLIKLAINGGDVAQTVAGVVDDVNTLTDSSASTTNRVIAAASLVSEVVSPVSGRDIKDGGEAIIKALKKGPDPNGWIARPHGSDAHNAAIDERVGDLSNDSTATNVRKNQQQVNIDGNKVGTNRPDVQFDQNGCHNCVEFDTVPSNGARHEAVIRSNDRNARVEINEVQ